MDNIKTSFEDNINQINRLIKLNISKWKLSGAIPSVSKEDIEQEIRLHIYERWDLYDPARPLGNWLTTVINRKILNLQRDNYYRFSKPCVALKCSSYLGAEECKIFGTCCSDCKLYADWEKEKKSKHDIRLPVSIENDNRLQKLSETPHEGQDIFEKLEELKFKLKESLTSNEFYIFNALYLENKTEAQILNELKFSSKTDGIRQIKAVKNTIYDKVKNVLTMEGLF